MRDYSKYDFCIPICSISKKKDVFAKEEKIVNLITAVRGQKDVQLYKKHPRSC